MPSSVKLVTVSYPPAFRLAHHRPLNRSLLLLNVLPEGVKHATI